MSESARPVARTAAWRPAARPLQRPLRAVLLVTLLTQLVSALWIVRAFESPNASTDVATHLAHDGVLAGGNWARLNGPDVPHATPMRAFQLPGYPIYLAAGFRVLPAPLMRFWSIPILLLLVGSVAYVALAVAGPAAALAAGAIAALTPFTVVHGPVWDDVYFGAACAWLLFAIVARRLTRDDLPGRRALLTALAFVAAAFGAWTRTEEQALALAVAVVVCMVPAYRAARREGLAMALGVIVALGAWGARNQATLGTFFVGSTHDGISLWESNNAATEAAMQHGQVEAFSTDPAVIGPLWTAARGLSEVDADKLFRQAGVRYVREHPVAAGMVMLEKAAISIVAYHPELPIAAPRNLVGLASAAALLVLAVVGLRALWRVERRVLFACAPFAVLIAGACVGMLLIGPIGTRYWITLQAALWVLAGVALARLFGGDAGIAPAHRGLPTASGAST